MRVWIEMIGGLDKYILLIKGAASYRSYWPSAVSTLLCSYVLKWSRPMSEALDFMHEVLTDKVEKEKSAMLPYTARCKRRFYKVSDNTMKGHSLVINPELGRYTSQKTHDTPARNTT